MTLRVTVEIVPFGDENNKQKISVMEVYNRGPSPYKPGYHQYSGLVNGKYGDTTPFGVINPILHNRNHGPWPLIQQAIAAFQEEEETK